MLTIEKPVSASTLTLEVPASQASPSLHQQSRVMEAMKTQYRVDQQVKFLHLQAEAESLFQQLKAIQHQRGIVSETVLEEVLAR
jgi:hypothetical protein